MGWGGEAVFSVHRPQLGVPEWAEVKVQLGEKRPGGRGKVEEELFQKKCS